MRRNHVTIKLVAKKEIDEERVIDIGEEHAIESQEMAIKGMLEEYMVYEDFDVEITATFEEEE